MEQTFKLFSIGCIYRENEKQMIALDSKFHKGLTYISMFSHAVILYECDTEPNIFHTNLCQKVIKLIDVKEKQGVLLVEGLDELNGNKTLYDIKPYFPNEDRVLNAKAPSVIVGKDTSLYRKSLSGLGLIRKIQGNYCLEIPENFEKYSKALQGYSHLKIIWWFHKFDKDVFRKTLECDPPYENAPKTGVFACRSPVRPNPIAVTTAKILDIDHKQNLIQVSVLDCFDKTPLLGISPYHPDKDYVTDYKLPEWLAHWPAYMEDSEFAIQNEPALSEPAGILLEKYMQQNPKGKLCAIDCFHKSQEQTIYNESGIVVKGARQNNLKNIDVTIPYGKITVITGVSGCGKSSLAFDTIYAESQQRFFANMSLSERSQFTILEKPKFDSITGLPPAIAISQQNVNRNPRSTVGTSTDLYNLLRTLFVTIGVRHCPECGSAIVKMTAEEIIDCLKNCRAGTKQNIKPINAGDYADCLIVPHKEDVTYCTYVNSLDKMIHKAIAEGMGAVNVQLNNEETLTFQTTEKCYECDHILFQLSTSDFSFNNTESMCPVCNGLGTIMEIDADSIIQDPTKSLLDSASSFWGNLRKFKENPNANWMKGEILALAQDMNIDLNIAWENLPKAFQSQAIFGNSNKEVTFSYKNNNGRTGTICRPVEGAYSILKRLLNSAGTESLKSMTENFMISKPCNCCKGERLKLESRLVTIAGTRFPEVIKMNLEELKDWISLLPNVINDNQKAISHPVLQELFSKLSDYIAAGLGYLTLDRSIPTLSGGEWQRLQLVSQLNSGLSNILYILDEPTAGLHPKDYAKLIEIIYQLKQLHNTIIIVEHAFDIMLKADYIIDIGKGAGSLGGHLTAQGSPQDIMNNTESETGMYLSGKKTLALKQHDRRPIDHLIRISGITGNNLQNINIKFPTNAVTCITGVSGSGKSSLVHYGILPAVQSCIDHSINSSKNYKKITGADQISNVIHITQSPIGRSSRSTPATYTGIMDELRSVFAHTKTAVESGYTQSNFSYNSKSGQCSVCNGYGYKTLDAPFMPTAKTECPLCKGTKFNAATLQIYYQEKNIAQILDLSIQQAYDFFKDNKYLQKILKLLIDIGLGYLTLGQNCMTLSGGEAQRIKLASQLHSNHSKHTLYLLDEPTTGLHFCDIQNLLHVLDKITENQNTVILVEHNLDVIKNADWIIDLGPEGGNHGGRLMIQGSSSDVMACKESYTGVLLSSQYEKQ